ncbi:MAG: Alpha-galactosidase [Mucilaginibacter sp.]|nr:Alpha-galactosidase [Mucilaginibacter sp.]
MTLTPADNIFSPSLRLITFILLCSFSLNAQTKHSRSQAGVTYYVDPNKGNDRNTGTAVSKPWKTFENLNRLTLSAGDGVKIITPGSFHTSLILKAKGTKDKPVKVWFAPGRYNFFPDGAVKKQLHITNTNDTPYALKAIALMFDSCRFVNVEAFNAATIVLRGKMIETFVNACDHIRLSGLNFDYQRPTVSELKVLSATNNYADVLIHKDSKYTIKDSLLTWQGEGWSYSPGSYWQVLDPVTNELERVDIPVEKAKFSSTGAHTVRIHFSQNPGFKTGMIYQNRDITRDCAGIFMRNSSNLWLKDLNIYFMHGMGVVSQYCNNIKIDHVAVRPLASSGRTCAAWADILHFAGCKGKIEVGNSYLSGANDDAINVHGIHLKILEKSAANQLKVRFMHNQTYGFNAYAAGDSIDFIKPQTLLAYGSNVVTDSKMLSDKEILLTLQSPVMADVQLGDAIENTTATPQVWIHHTTIARIPTRGILTTTRRKVVIDNNNLQRTYLTGILVSDDAANWYESGMVKDLTVSNNNFYYCGGPVIAIHPENQETGNAAVHSNITVTGNHFYLKDNSLFSAKNTANIKLINNDIKLKGQLKKMEDLIKLDHCTDVKTSPNNINVLNK